MEETKGIQCGGSYLSFYLPAQLQGDGGTETQLSSIFVLKTSKLHLKSVSILERETKSILTSN